MKQQEHSGAQTSTKSIPFRIQSPDLDMHPDDFNNLMGTSFSKILPAKILMKVRYFFHRYEPILFPEFSANLSVTTANFMFVT